VDIVRCVCQGLTNDEIGEKLYISRFTVETHLKNIFDKTKVKHRAGLAGLLQPL
jgi:DNA-binding CsgD family transcriptional regulator